MTINEHISEFAGLKVLDYSPEDGIANPDKCAFRLGLNWESFDEGEKLEELLAAFVTDPGAKHVAALIISDWGGAGQGDSSASVVEAIVSAREQLAGLRALFLGEIICEESEISWITQSDVSAVFEAFPALTELWLRGANGLQLGRPKHGNLRKLVIETGGMPAALFREVVSADLPLLEHLELWLGDDGYGNDVSPEDLRSLLTGNRFPKLKHLGLRDDCRADVTASVLAAAGIPGSLESLDLSLGTLSDEGAEALAASKWLPQLKKLDLHHHFISDATIKKLKKVVPVVVDSERQELSVWNGEGHRYVAVSE